FPRLPPRPPPPPLFPYTTLFRSGRANAALEKPGFVVESVRVGAAVRPAQAHRESPALPGPHRKDALGIVRGESAVGREHDDSQGDRKSTRLNSSHLGISYAVFCL